MNINKKEESMKKIGFIIFILALGCKGKVLSLQKEEKDSPQSK
jgi:hypothetical protein